MLKFSNFIIEQYLSSTSTNEEEFSNPNSIFILSSSLKSILFTDQKNLPYRGYFFIENQENFENLYKCQMGCTFKTNCFEDLKAHLKNHFILSSSNHNNFESNKSKGNEIEEIHINPNSVSDLSISKESNDSMQFYHFCNLCSFKTKRLFQLKIHQRICHLESSKFKFKCTLCPHTTSSLKNFKIHQSNHEPGRYTDYFKCRYCNYHDKRKSHITYHERLHPEYQRFKKNKYCIYKCKLCPFKSNRLILLNKHVEKHVLHKDNSSRFNSNYIKCRYCEFYEKKLSITKHEKLHPNFKYRTFDELVPDYSNIYTFTLNTY